MAEKLVFKDIQYFGAGRLKVPAEQAERYSNEPFDDDSCLVSYLDADLIDRESPTNVKPEWWREAVRQSEEVRACHGRTLIVRYPDGSYMVSGRYLESFWSWLGKLDSDGVAFDRFIGGILVESPVWTLDTNSKLSEMGVSSSSVASTYISPETEQSAKLKKHALLAQEQGFHAPDKAMFPSKRSLLPHQEPVVQTMAWRGKGILADDVGSGKSSMFICGYLSLIQYLRRMKGVADRDTWPLVIVTKKRLIEPTERECKLWYEDCKTHIAEGKNGRAIPDDVNIILCPITTLEARMDEILSLHPKGVIFDESHMLKNPAAKRTKSALKISSWIKDHNQHPYVICASATPMPNRPSELWTQIEITGMDTAIAEHMDSVQKFPAWVTLRNNYSVRPDSRMKFEIRYCEGNTGRFGWEAKGSRHEHELSELLRRNGLIRRKKSEFITPLPLLHQNFVRCKVDEQGINRYQLAEKQFRDHLVASARKKARSENWSETELQNEIRDKLEKTNNSEHIMKMTEVRRISGEIKIPYIVNWVQRFFDGDPKIVGRETDRNKLIIFAHHKEVQKQITNHPDIQKHGVLSITSGTKNVNDIVDEFQEPNSGKNVIVLYSEAREGLTLTAAKDVLVAEMPFVPSWLIQMGGRCWARFSELYAPHEAHLHYAVADVEIDKYLEDMIRAKGWLHRAIIDGEKASDVINSAESGEMEEEDFTNATATRLASSK